MFGALELGQATIVARTETGTHGQGGSQGRDTFHYIADVEPDSGAPVFRATFDEKFRGTRFHYPNVGERARVRFNPKSQKVELDHSVQRADMKAAKEAGKEEFDAIARAAPGTAPPSAQSPANLRDPELEELERLEAEDEH